MKRHNTVTAILGGLGLIVATVWYLVIYVGNELVGATGYLFMLLSILIFFGGISMVQLLLSRKKKFFISAPFLILLAYFILSMAISLVFMIKPVEKKTLLIIIQVLLLALIVISMFMMLAAEHSTPSTDFASMEWNDPLRNLINKLRALKDDPENRDYKDSLSRLYERAVFLDTSQKMSQDELLIKGVGDLEIVLISQDYALGSKREAVDAAVGELEELFKAREYEIRKSPWNKI